MATATDSTDNTSTGTTDPSAALENDTTTFEDLAGTDAETTDETDTEQTGDDTDSDTADDDTDTEADTSTDDDAEDTADDTVKDKPEPKETDDAKLKAKEAFEKREQQRLAKEQAKREAQEAYIDQAGDDEQARALRELQINAYNDKIERNTDKLHSALDRAMANIDLFQDKRPAVQNAMVRAVDRFEALYVTKDENGDPINVNGDLQQYLQDEADSIRELVGTGATQQDTAKTRQKSRTLSPPVSSPKKEKADPMIDAFKAAYYDA